MTADPIDQTDGLLTLVRRADALEALATEPLDRRDLEARLGVSKPTVHRLTRTLGERGIVERSDGVFALTALGEVLAAEVATFARNVATARRLSPLFAAVEEHEPPFDHDAFAGATVTSAEPIDPYRPVRRFRSLVAETTTLRGFDTTPIASFPLDASQHPLDGTTAEFVYPPAIVEHLLSSDVRWVNEALESGRLVLRVHDDVPHGLALFDDRVGIGRYCETTGALRTFVDTDAPAACEWARAVYDSYRATAEPVVDERRVPLPAVPSLTY